MTTFNTAPHSTHHFTQNISSLNTSLHSTHHYTQHITSLHTSLHSTHHFTQHILHSTHQFTQHITSLNTSLHSNHHFTQHNIVIFYYPLKHNNINQQYVNIILHSWETCFGCKQPSSCQNRTKFMYTESVQCMESHIVYNYWYTEIVCWLILEKKLKPTI